MEYLSLNKQIICIYKSSIKVSNNYTYIDILTIYSIYGLGEKNKDTQENYKQILEKKKLD